MKDVKYYIPQNDAKILGDLMFADQAVDHNVFDMDRKKEEYSPTGNSWN